MTEKARQSVIISQGHSVINIELNFFCLVGGLVSKRKKVFDWSNSIKTI